MAFLAYVKGVCNKEIPGVRTIQVHGDSGLESWDANGYKVWNPKRISGIPHEQWLEPINCRQPTYDILQLTPLSKLLRIIQVTVTEDYHTYKLNKVLPLLTLWMPRAT